jgi:glycosyltransferase involved in cell wall biosynthesis
LRILHVDTGRELRGGQHQVLLLLNGLRAAGEECTLLARAGSPLFQSAGEADCRVYPASLKNLWGYSRKADVLHAHDAHAHSLAAISARVPFVVSRRVAFPIKRSLLSRWKYRQAIRFLAVSQFVASGLERAGINKNKIDVVYDGVPTDIKPAEWSAKQPVVALASHDPAKGRDLVAEAARLADVPVTYSNDLPNDLNHASMFLYITRAEGLGSAALLAMAMGVPVIASDVGGLPEALGFGDAGLLTPNDANQIAAAMRRLLDDPTLALTLIERAKKRVASSFTAQRMVESTLTSYRRALAL